MSTGFPHNSIEEDFIFKLVLDKVKIVCKLRFPVLGLIK